MPKGLKSCPEEEGLNLSCMTSQERIRVEEGACEGFGSVEKRAS